MGLCRAMVVVLLQTKQVSACHAIESHGFRVRNNRGHICSSGCLIFPRVCPKWIAAAPDTPSRVCGVPERAALQVSAPVPPPQTSRQDGWDTTLLVSICHCTVTDRVQSSCAFSIGVDVHVSKQGRGMFFFVVKLAAQLLQQGKLIFISYIQPSSTSSPSHYEYHSLQHRHYPYHRSSRNEGHFFKKTTE